MRILYLNYGPQSGVTAAVSSRLRAAGHEVVHADPVEGYLYAQSFGAWRVPNLHPVAVLGTAAALARFGRRWKAWYLHTCWAFDRLSERCDRAIAAAHPDVVLQAGALFAPGRCPDRPTYLFCDRTRALHEAHRAGPGVDPPIPFEPAWRRREERAYRSATAIFTMSEYARRSLVETYRVDPRRVQVVGAGPNVAPGPGPRPRPRPATFLSVGKEFVPKGGPELLEAFAVVRARHPEAELWVVGGGQPGTAPPGVKLLGRLPLHDVGRLYARASAFVLPTRREAFGLAFLEAMSFGLPCIGTAIEAIPEIVVDGRTGLLVPPCDAAALARAMGALLDDPLRARDLGEAGRARVEARYGWDRAVARMREVLENGSPGPQNAEGAARRATPSPSTSPMGGP